MAGRRPERRLATVLFLDIVDSTRIAGEVGDRRWRDMVREFRRIVRRQLRAHRGHEEDTAGDGFFATFTRPASAVHAATRIVVAVQRLGLDVRCGIHTGELERIDRRLGGIAAHIGARVMAQATAAEVLVTGTVHDLVVGSGISFSPPADTELKGVPGRWALYQVEKVEGVALPAPLGPEAERPQLGGQGRESAVPAPVLVLAVSTVLLAAAMGTYALLPRADPSAGALSSPTAEPDQITLLRIDPETNEIEGKIRDDYLSVYRPSPLTVVDGTLWQETPINLVRRNLGTGAAEETIDLPPNTWAVHFGFGSIWLVRYDGVSTNFIERVDPVSGVVIATIELDRGTVQASTIGRGGIWLLKGRDLLEVSPTLNALVDTDTIEAATTPNGMTSVGDLLWICECSEGRLIHFDPDADVVLGPPVEFAQRGIVLPDYRIASQGAVSIDEQTMWLLDASGATVTPLDAASGEPAGQPMGIPPAVSGHVFGFGSLWLAAGASVHRIELESREITGIRMPEGVLGRGIALDEPTGAVWVSNCREGYIQFRPGCEE